ncbi:MAG: CaiB/BaiF CoA transferase family protein [Promethearchaeota archaeon]
MPLPLEHITVLDLTRMLPGPYCTMILADLGANVIRVENPNFPYANLPPFFQKRRTRVSVFNYIIMRNKKSMTLNLKKPKAREIFYKLVERSDVIVESFRPRVAEKLKIDYQTLSKINKSIIYCSLTGYGQDGPYEQIAGHDLNYVGICGMLDLNRPRSAFNERGKEHPPIVPCMQSADIGGGLISTIGILSALIERERNEERVGQYLDISMTDTVFSFIPMTAAYHFSESYNQKIDTKNPLHGDFPFYSIYKTKDDKYITVGAIEMKFWHDLCKGLGREDLILKQTVRGEEKEKVFKELEKEFRKKTRDEWFEVFKNLDACVMPVKTFGEACEDPQIKARNMIVDTTHPKLGKLKNIASPIKMSRTPLTIRSIAPKVGQHAKEILKSLNYSDEEIRELKRNGVI